MTQPSDAPTEQLPRYSRPEPLTALRTWSGGRPWLGGLLTVLGGLTIIFLPTAGFAVVLLPGIAGISGFLGGLVIGMMLGIVGGSLGFAWTAGDD
jgi:hypothetical protein